MNASIRSAVLAALICGFGVAACSKSEPTAAQVAATLTESASASVAPVGDDPCAIVTKGEVRDAFPGAKSGKRDHSMDQYGMASCTWELPTNTLAAQIFKGTNTADEELRGRMLGFLDPLQPGLRAKIQYDAIAGL